jgi:hypothetical protein
MATIGKTFSDPDKWEEPWFISLTPGKKLLFTYLWERCDHAGVIHITLPLWSAHTGLNIDETLFNEFVEEVNQDHEKVSVFGKKLWFTEYIRFNQQSDPTLPLSDKYSFHKHVFKTILKHGLKDEVNRRDPILLLNFVDNDSDISLEETIHPKPYLSLSKGLPKSTGKGAGRGKGKGLGKGAGEGTPRTNSDNEQETVNDFELRNKFDAKDTPFNY